MFKIEKAKTIKWPVAVNIPRDGGKTTKATFNAEFNLLPQDELDTILRDGGNDQDIGCAVLTGWDGVAGDDGAPLSFSDEARDYLLKITYVRSAILAAYFQCASGREAARKN